MAIEPFDKSRRICEKFISEVYLTDFEKEVLRTRIVMNWTQKKQARELHCSLSTINRTIKRLKELYDEVQKDCPELPIRRSSKEEDYLDNN